MINNYRALMVETQPGSLAEVAFAINGNMNDVKLKLYTDLKNEVLPKVDFAIVEIAKESDLFFLQSIVRHGIKIIAVLYHEDYLKSVLSFDATAIIVFPLKFGSILRAIERIKVELNIYLNSNRFDSRFHLPQLKGRHTIILPTIQGFEVIHINDIIKIQTDKNYSVLYLFNGKKRIVSKSLQEIESMLPQDIFFKSHVSHLINLNSVVCYKKEDGGAIVLADGSKVPVAKQRKEELIEVLTIR